MREITVMQAITQMATLRSDIDTLMSQLFSQRGPVKKDGVSIVSKEESSETILITEKLEEAIKRFSELKSAVEEHNNSVKIDGETINYWLASNKFRRSLVKQFQNNVGMLSYRGSSSKTVDNGYVIDNGWYDEKGLNEYIKNNRDLTEEISTKIDEVNATVKIKISW